MSESDIDFSVIINGESPCSIASFASYRLHREMGDNAKINAKEIDYASMTIAYGNETRRLAGKFEEEITTPFLFLSDLLMELHHIQTGTQRNSKAIGRLSESNVELLTQITTNTAIYAFNKAPISAASTLPFRCIEDYDECQNSKNNKKWCTTALVVCMLQCIVPLARGAGATSNSGESSDDSGED